MALLDVLKKNKYKNGFKKKEVRNSGKESKMSLSNNGHNLLSNNVTRQFYITLAEPHRIWKPNEHIVGETTLEIKKDITNVAIRLSLICEMKVKTRGNSPTTLMSRKTTRLIERSTFLYGFDMSKEIQNKVDESSNISSIPVSCASSTTSSHKFERTNDDLIDENGDIKIVNGLTKGIHKFPFRIKLPKNNKKLFSSIKFERGSINYFMQCTLEPLSSIQSESTCVSKCRNDFEVIVPLDVSHLPIPKTKSVVLQSFTGAPMVHKKSNSSGDAGSSLFSKLTNKSNDSNGSGTVTPRSNESSISTPTEKTVNISVSLPRSGYIMGEVIPVKIEIDHYKPYYHAAGVIVTLVRICRVGTNNEADGIPIEKFRKDICQYVSPLYIDPETLRTNVLAHLKVPLDAFATFNPPNQFFSFQYYIEVMVNLSRKNLVYTESNKILGGAMDENDEEVYQNMNNKLKINKISSSKLFGLEKNIQQKMSALVNNNDDNNRYDQESETIGINGTNEQETKILYKDMVNVESIKGMRNVTGMSIEIVVGTTKESVKPDRLGLVENTNSEVIHHSIDSNEPEPSVTAPQSDSSELNLWLSNYPTHCKSLPVPKYTPREEFPIGSKQPIIISEDKKELERLRLQELESEPPENY
ncbi:ph-response sensor protein [Maudiozyma exigua]|uniref:pH-response regulator protein palF/RIM8 n=1 Tax=Maudiozyma exigua TaxID=34358 RepID=A0A9P6VSP4_MAUEX|nr:ph-response sensor protein [Kazachstania exigua]